MFCDIIQRLQNFGAISSLYMATSKWKSFVMLVWKYFFFIF